MYRALLAVVLLGLLVSSPVATASATTPTSQWLAKQLAKDGTLQNPLGGTLPDHGLMIDTLFAMYASGNGDLAAPIARYLDRHATDYYTWDGLMPGQGYDAVITGGAVAKTLVAAEVSGHDPRHFGGHDMVAETKAAIMRSGPDKGRIVDYSKNPDFKDMVSNNANMFGQALAVIGLAGVHAVDRLALDKMLTQQCSAGYFRIFFGYIATKETGDHVTPHGYKVSTCDEDKSPADGDTTGLALSAMLASRAAGATGLDGRIAKTVKWLKANQAPSGGWGGGVGTEAPNTNSTGLIVQALADAGGADVAVAKGVAFLRSAQVTAEADAGNRLKDQIGAIAYTPGAYKTARTEGLSGLDTWIRASAQASLGLSQVGFTALTRRDIPVGPPEPPAATPPPSHAPVPSHPAKAASLPDPTQATPAARLGGYLAGKLVGGDHVETTQDGKTYVDYDLTADLVLALRTLGEQPEAVSRATRFLLSPDAIKAYAHGVPYEQGPASYAEPLAKLEIIARFEGVGDPQFRTDLAALRTPDGEFVDTGAFADSSRSVRRQAWAIMATSGTAESLLAHRCQDGTFPVALTTTTCATGDLAATAAAVETLRSPALAAALPDGVVLARDGSPDVALSSVIAGARQAAGLDVSATARTLSGLMQPDGGLAKTPGSASDLVTSVAAAPGIAGRSWTSAPGSPVTAAPSAEAAPAPTLAARTFDGLPLWLYLRLTGLGLALAVGVFAVRHTTFKGETP